MELGKVDAQFGKKVRRKIIDEILIDPEIIQAAKKYKPSKKESKLIPFAISIRSRFFLELACIKRAKEVVRLSLQVNNKNMKKKYFKFTRPYVFVPMCADYLHHIYYFYKKLASMEMSS